MSSILRPPEQYGGVKALKKLENEIRFYSVPKPEPKQVKKIINLRFYYFNSKNINHRFKLI